jgi:hypothetical protein
LAGLDAINNNNASQWTFYWEYEYPECSNGTQPTLRATVGATVTANNSASDFALLHLYANQDPFNLTGVIPYYLGWDRSGNAGTGGIGIHHPQGDVKKISTYTMTPQSTAYSSNTINPSENHWRVIWVQTVTNHGVTEEGSSGSPLINNYRRVIGQLHGGRADCNEYTYNGNHYGKNDPDWYGKFSVSWNNSTDPKRRLSNWLDPNNTGVTVLDGCSYLVNFTNQTVTSNTTVTSCGDINVQNVKVQNGAKLILDAAGEVNIISDFEVELGSEFEIK